MKLISGIVRLIILILGRVLARREPPKSAKENLKGPSPTVVAVSDAQRKAEEKFGPRQ